MGVEDYLLASSLLGVMAQRLVRRLCSHCRRPHPMRPELAAQLGGGDLVEYDAEGCTHCSGTGYFGRQGIYELFVVEDEIRKLIVAHATADRIKAEAQRLGMRSLRDDGWRTVCDGATSVAEVLRVTQDQ